jgi:PTH2 family peptidyl-tRNA hydrolase
MGLTCKGGCGTEIPEIGLSLRERDGDIIMDLWPEKGDDGPWCGDCAEKEGQRRVDELDVADLAAEALRGVKQVIVIRQDLGMRRGKEIAQGAHAAMAWLSKRIRETFRECSAWVDFSPAEAQWIGGSFKKVTCRVNSEEELLAVAARAREAGLQVEEITDSGETEFHGVPTLTCIAVGPDYEDRFTGVTDGLRLY